MFPGRKVGSYKKASRKVYRKSYSRRKGGNYSRANATFPGNFVINHLADSSSGAINAFGTQATSWVGNNSGTSTYGSSNFVMNPTAIVSLFSGIIVNQHALGVTTPPPNFAYIEKFHITEWTTTFRVVNRGSNSITLIAYPWVARKTTTSTPSTIWTTPESLDSFSVADTYDEQGMGVNPFMYSEVTQSCRLLKPRAVRLGPGAATTFTCSFKGNYSVDPFTLTSGMIAGVTRGIAFTGRGDPCGDTAGAGATIHGNSVPEFIVGASSKIRYRNSVYPVVFHDFANYDTVATTGQQIIQPMTGAVQTVVYA